MLQIPVTKEYFSAQVEAMIRINRNIAYLGKDANEVDENTVRIWCINSNQPTLVANKGPQDLYRVVLPSVKAYWHSCFHNWITLFSNKVHDQFPMESSFVLPNPINAVGTTEDFVMCIEHHIYDLYEKSMSIEIYRDELGDVKKHLSELLAYRFLVQNESVEIMAKWAKCLAMICKVIMLKNGTWSELYYNAIMGDARIESDTYYQNPDILANILLTIGTPSIRKVLVTSSAYRDSNLAEIVVNMIILRGSTND